MKAIKAGARGRTRGIAALVGAIAVMTTACGGRGGGSEDAATATITATTAPDPELVTATTWSDGDDHAVVPDDNGPTDGAGDAVRTTAPDTTEPDTTEPDTTGPDTTGPDTTGPDTTGPDTTMMPASGNTLPVSTVAPRAAATSVSAEAASARLGPSSAGPTGAPSPAEASRTDTAAGERNVLVVHTDGSTERMIIPDGSLQMTRVLTRVELDLVASYADQPLSVLVQDADGVVGEPGRRYVMVPGRLIAVAQQPGCRSATCPATSG